MFLKKKFFFFGRVFDPARSESILKKWNNSRTIDPNLSILSNSKRSRKIDIYIGDLRGGRTSESVCGSTPPDRRVRISRIIKYSVIKLCYIKFNYLLDSRYLTAEISRTWSFNDGLSNCLDLFLLLFFERPQIGLNRPFLGQTDHADLI